MRGGKPFAERAKIFKIAAGTVQQNDLRLAGGRCADLNDVLAQAAGRDPAPARRITPLDHARPDQRRDGADAEDRGDGDDDQISRPSTLTDSSFTTSGIFSR